MASGEQKNLIGRSNENRDASSFAMMGLAAAGACFAAVALALVV